MSLFIGNYEFAGPYRKFDQLKPLPGLYAGGDSSRLRAAQLWFYSVSKRHLYKYCRYA